MPSRGGHLRQFIPGLLALLLVIGLITALWQIATPINDIYRPPTSRNRRKLDDGLLNALLHLQNAVETMQSRYFDTFLGTWPQCIDWTAAVMGTHVAGSLYSLTRSVEYNFALEQHSSSRASRSDNTWGDAPYSAANRFLSPASSGSEEGRAENSIGGYFADTISYYYGQDAFALRQQANDDMLWVVLGWLETVRFVGEHDRKHYRPADDKWWGNKFTAAFAHRARIFYDLAARGWDEKDCGGGMIWNPHLVPYKNAITNELFISASVAMFLYFPGDNNTSPFSAPQNYNSDGLQFKEACNSSKCDQNLDQPVSPNDDIELSKAPGHADRYLRAAVKAYNWLQRSDMRNSQGLYIDGFHISRPKYGEPGVCDQRNTMVYTYNQGVILSAQRGLWESTGNAKYLADGHQLIRNVIAATCYDLDSNQHESEPQQQQDDNENGTGWCGLGQDGILEDYCDALGICSQDAQNFKGIFFHHMTLFCESLPRDRPTVPGKSFTADDELWALHRQSCEKYSPWVVRNALGALNSRDKKGRFGGWWNKPRRTSSSSQADVKAGEDSDDYRNFGLQNARKWGVVEDSRYIHLRQPATGPMTDERISHGRSVETEQHSLQYETRDLNDRGRGRTVETQGAGVAVVRAMWEFVFEHVTNPGYDAAAIAYSSWPKHKSQSSQVPQEAH